jgi:glucuronide carrier protein
LLFAISRETVERDTTPVSLRQSVGAIRPNQPLLLLCLSALFVLTGLFILQTLQMYYARDVLGNADYTIILTVLTTGAMFLVSPAIPKIVETVGKKPAYLVAGVITVVGAPASRWPRPRSWCCRWSASPCMASVSPRCSP